ncbi:MAG: tetratricopeptide repeat protein [Pedobacter sp.]|jgi:tetratricopeptide (TPR) repeat protein|uniref:tetratricopeptide repeat protein n=1 Tax=Pedobacter sp. TaxID=1411316 RepID=UPI00356909C6
MKKVLLSILFVGVATLANAQKSEVAEAKRTWDLYSIMATKNTFDKSMFALNNGLKHTDNAIANEKSKVMPDAWSYRALFASAIAYTDSVNVDNALAKQKIAVDAIAQAKSLDTKGDQKDNIQSAEINIRNAINSRAIRAYNKKDYANALTLFNEIIALNPTDTAMYINAGVTAKLVENYPEAIKNFKKVISFNVPETKNFYAETISMTLVNLKDTTAGLALLKEAIAKYPDDADFVGTETDIYIAKGDIVKSQEALKKLIAKDPSKAIYQYLMGDTYYKQALVLQADRNKLDPKKIKEFDAITAKMVVFIDQSMPFYKKAIELDPKFVPALESLKQIYGFKNDSANFNDIKKRLDAIPAN